MSFENLILLCANCHREIDNDTSAISISKMREWKHNRNKEIETHFTQIHSTFDGLRNAVDPILRRNREIFNNYGPGDSDQRDTERYKLWLKFENEILANNRCLELALSKNKILLPQENQEIVDTFISHVREFEETRGNNSIFRLCLFPQELLSIFGIEEALVGLPPNFSALQNFVSRLINTNRFVSLCLDAEPHLIYLECGFQETLRLEDRPRVQQIFWNGYFFKPKITDLRIQDLTFFVQWVRRNGVSCECDDLHDLSSWTLDGKHKIKVKLCYKYVLSLLDLYMMTLTPGDTVVNMHRWNGAPIGNDAHEYASQIGVRLFSQSDFFKFVHRSLK